MTSWQRHSPTSEPSSRGERAIGEEAWNGNEETEGTRIGYGKPCADETEAEEEDLAR
jgi:hypothetical protein